MAELISVIIPSYRNSIGLSKTLASFLALKDPDIEVIAIDDASPVPLSQLAKASLVRLNTNQGPGIARNEGVKRAKGKILAFTDSDCMVTPDWIQVIRKAFEDQSVTAVAGTFTGEPQRSSVTWLRSLESTFYHLQERCLVNCFTSANFAIRKEAFERAGGFPPMRIGEDLILGYKMFLLGMEVLWLPELKVKQEFRPTLLQYFRQQRLWSAAALRSMLTFPQISSMKWPVRRGTLNIQLVLTGLAVVLIPCFWMVKPEMLGTVMGSFLGIMTALNASFLLHVLKKTNPIEMLKIFALVLLWRNVAWLFAAISVVINYPGLFVKGFFRLALKVPAPKINGSPATLTVA